MVKPNLKNAVSAVGKAVAAVVSGENLLVSDKVLEERLLTCAACEFLEPGARQCLKCTCFVDIKANLTTESCPEKKWKE